MTHLFRRISSAVIAIFAASMVFAFEPAKSAEDSVSEGVAAILASVRKHSSSGDEQARELFIAEVTEILEPLVGYSVVARRVLGDAYDVASKEQKIRFLRTFKRSMINTYAGGIYSFGAYEVVVLPSQDDKKDTLRNTRVYLEVISPEGPKYPLVQSVYYSKSSESWKMQNAIFNGINLGVTFRTQFEQIYRDTNGDLDKTIIEWERITEEAYQAANFRKQ